MYKIKIAYNDKHELDVNLADEDYEAFSASLSSGQVFWDKNNKMGFWTNLNSIRYMQLERLEEKAQEVQVPPEAIEIV